MDESRAAFEDAFRADYPDVVRVIAPIVGSVEDAEAVAQDAFVKAYTRWKRIGRYDRPGAWVQRVAIRDAVRLAERSRRTVPGPTAERDAGDTVAAHVDLHAAMVRLPAKQRACIVLHYLADQPVSEVASALGCKEATVRVHLHRARAALAGLLRPDREEMKDGR